MHADGTHRVVNFELLVDELNAEHHCEARDQPDNGRAERVHCVAAGRDGHKPGQRTVQRHRDVWLFVTAPGNDHHHTGCHSCGQVGIDEDETGVHQCLVPRHRNGGAAVEAEPAEPQDKAAQRGQCKAVARDGVRLAVLRIFADARPHHLCADERAQAAHHMHCRAARKVVEAQLAQPAQCPPTG